jgi:glutathione S-transferase
MLKVWGRKNSINVQKVMWTVGELALDHERVDAGGQFGRTKDPEYLAMNPNALVPTIDDNGFVLWESNAIVRYLAAKHTAGRLWPADVQARADADRWMDWAITTVIPAMGPVFWGLIRTPPEKRDAAAIEASRVKCADALSIFDKHISKRDFAGGKSLSMGDIPIGCAVNRWYSLPIERPKMPALEAYYQRLQQRTPYKTHVMIPLT